MRRSLSNTRRLLVLLICSACWTGTAPVEPLPPSQPNSPAPPPEPSSYSRAEARAVRCSENNQRAILLFVQATEQESFEVAFAESALGGRRFEDGPIARMSPCHSHGCSRSVLSLDTTLALGKRFRGLFQIAARAGMTYVGQFEARWTSIAWATEPCDRV
jgi:hypothetical protein